MPELQVKRGPSGLARQILEEGIVGEMRVLGQEGDTRVTWNARDTDEVAAARTQFDQLRGQGFLAYAVEEGSGGRGEQIREFDPNAQKMIMVPPMAGGSQLAEPLPLAPDAVTAECVAATDAECYAVALDWANVIRAEYRLPRLEAIPQGYQGASNACALSRALHGIPDTKLVPASEEPVLHPRAAPRGQKPGLSFQRDGRMVRIQPPPLVFEFARRFDAGRYPELIEHPPMGIRLLPL